jgi:hypothetical protein
VSSSWSSVSSSANMPTLPSAWPVSVIGDIAGVTVKMIDPGPGEALSSRSVRRRTSALGWRPRALSPCCAAPTAVARWLGVVILPSRGRPRTPVPMPQSRRRR